ncbi:MAG: serpin family protein [Bacteroidota bacterium]
MRTIGLSLLVILFGCSSTKKLEQKNSATSNQTVKSVATSVNQFSLSLYETLSEPGENLFYSPYSISLAMNMAYLGSAGETETEFQKALYFGSNNTTYHQLVKQLNDSLTQNKESENTINIANAFWLQEAFNLEEAYQKNIKNFYDGAVNYADFKEPASRETARKEVNKWVEDKTNEKIENLIGQGVLDDNTRMILVNAIYFFGKWQSPFIPGKNEDKPFSNADGTESNTTFMQKDLTLPYYENENLQAVSLPYEEDEFSMVVLMKKDPEANGSYASLLNFETVNELLSNPTNELIHLELPKFKLEEQYDLVAAFKEMGMQEAFGMEANFSGMREKNDLNISNIIHKAFVEVNEEGTEAAAATGVVMSLKMANMPPDKSFIVDRPFVFFIRHNNTGAILFFGEVNQLKESR